MKQEWTLPMMILILSLMMSSMRRVLLHFSLQLENKQEWEKSPSLRLQTSTATSARLVSLTMNIIIIIILNASLVVLKPTKHQETREEEQCPPSWTPWSASSRPAPPPRTPPPLRAVTRSPSWLRSERRVASPWRKKRRSLLRESGNLSGTGTMRNIWQN